MSGSIMKGEMSRLFAFLEMFVVQVVNKFFKGGYSRTAVNLLIGGTLLGQTHSSPFCLVKVGEVLRECCDDRRSRPVIL